VFSFCRDQHSSEKLIESLTMAISGNPQRFLIIIKAVASA
jgi:hypothetical protein